MNTVFWVPLTELMEEALPFPLVILVENCLTTYLKVYVCGLNLGFHWSVCVRCVKCQFWLPTPLESRIVSDTVLLHVPLNWAVPLATLYEFLRRAVMVAQQGKLFATEPDHWVWSPEPTRGGGRKLTLAGCPRTPTYIPCCMHTDVNEEIQTKIKIFSSAKSSLLLDRTCTDQPVALAVLLFVNICLPVCEYDMSLYICTGQIWTTGLKGPSHFCLLTLGTTGVCYDTCSLFPFSNDFQGAWPLPPW